MGLADFIKQDLKHRLITGENTPAKLTLCSLSEHYGVSLTPVRAAIGALIEEGIVHKHANGRLGFERSAVTCGAIAQTIPRPPTAEDWNRVLMKEIMRASLGGDAVYLREEALARKYNVGRSVIRQTFSRLSGAGLIEHVARCGWLVAPFREDDMHAYLEIREVLELKALDMSRPHLERKDLLGMLEDNAVPDKGQPIRMDNRLHHYWIDRSGNRYIQGFFRQHVAEYYTLLFEHAAPETAVVAEVAGQHRHILEALLKRHWERARVALSEHIWTQERVLSKLLDRGAS